MFLRENVDVPLPSALQFSGTRKVGSGYPTGSTCLYLGLCGRCCEFVHGSTATGSVPLILALGGPLLLGLGVRPPRSVSHLYPLLTLMLRVLRCLLRKKRREKPKREGREKEKEERPTPSLLTLCRSQNVSVRRFKTLLCVLAKRAHVEHMRAFCQHRRKRFESTHGDVLNLHTEGFFACHFPRAKPRQTQTTHTTDSTTHHTPQTRHIAHEHQHQHHT